MLLKFLKIFSSIALLVGFLMKVAFSVEGAWPMLLIAFGVVMKVYSLVEAIVNKTYKPGKELWLLIVGLAIFLTGLQLDKHEVLSYAPVITYFGLSLKILFVVFYVRKMRA